MRHLIYKLRFSTPVHFGSDTGGDHLSSSRMTFRADTLFSALYREAMRTGSENAFLSSAQDHSLSFSDAFPWKGDRLYVPRPMGRYAPPVQEEDPSRRKLMKKVEYLPIDSLNDYLHGAAAPGDLLADFGKQFQITRVNLRDNADPLPYLVSGFRFAENAGLYVIVSAADDTASGMMSSFMSMISYAGIGGKTSSGWGKFTFECIPAPESLVSMLNDEHAPLQVLLSTAYPEDSALESVVERASYALVRRGGFSCSEASQPMKKRTCYFFSAGSVFAARFSGTIPDVGQNMPHPVYRYAKAMFMGVNRP